MQRFRHRQRRRNGPWGAVALCLSLAVASPNSVAGSDVPDCDAVDYLRARRQSTVAWSQLEAALAAAFDAAAVAGAWPSEVDNWTPLRWRCTVAADTGTLRGCIWLLAGSSERWRRRGGWCACAHVAHCHMPASGPLDALVSTLLSRGDGAALMAVPWPGHVATLESRVAACLARANSHPLCE